MYIYIKMHIQHTYIYTYICTHTIHKHTHFIWRNKKTIKVICTFLLVWAIKIPHLRNNPSCATQKVWSRRPLWKWTSLEHIPEINLASPYLPLYSVLQPPGEIFHLVRPSLSTGHMASTLPLPCSHSTPLHSSSAYRLFLRI